jgi:hypothetical protein
MLYAGVVIIDMSEIDDFADYGGLLSELKRIGIRDGKEYQVDNAGDLLMYYDAYEKCKSTTTARGGGSFDYIPLEKLDLPMPLK